MYIWFDFRFFSSETILVTMEDIGASSGWSWGLHPKKSNNTPILLLYLHTHTKVFIDSN
jgi:hypothetical protein